VITREDNSKNGKVLTSRVWRLQHRTQTTDPNSLVPTKAR